MAEMAIIARLAQVFPIKIVSANNAKNAFGVLIDTALSEPVTVENHGRAVLVVLSVGECARLLAAIQRRNGTKEYAPDGGGKSRDEAEQPQNRLAEC